MWGDGLLHAWAIYRHPDDYPNHYVVRRCTIEPGNPDPLPNPVACLCGSLEAARSQVPAGLLRFLPPAKIMPGLVETWI
jgi:hypothetical protein